jgi:hypothetical protein
LVSIDLQRAQLGEPSDLARHQVEVVARNIEFLQPCALTDCGRKVVQHISAEFQLLELAKVADLSRQGTECVVPQVQRFELREPPDRCGDCRDRVMRRVQRAQVFHLPDLRREGRQFVARKVQTSQGAEIQYGPGNRRQAVAGQRDAFRRACSRQERFGQGGQCEIVELDILAGFDIRQYLDRHVTALVRAPSPIDPVERFQIVRIRPAGFLRGPTVFVSPGQIDRKRNAR